MQKSTTMQGGGQPQAAQNQPFLSDVATLRQRARQHIEAGAVTPSYQLDTDTVVNVLNVALDRELGDHERARDLAVRGAGADQRQDFVLT